MKKINWVIEKYVFGRNENERRLVDILIKNKQQYKLVNYDSSINKDLVKKYESLFDNNVIYYGSLNLATKLRGIDWNPGIYGSDITKYDCLTYYPYFGDNMLNNNFITTTYGELKTDREKIYKHFNSDVIFVRPTSILKEFTGCKVHRNNFDNAYNLMGFYQVKEYLPIIVSSIKNVKKEYRFVIINGEVISGSLYTIGDKNVYLGIYNDGFKAMDYAKEMCKLYNPDDVWILDICETDKGYKIMEIGAFSYSELYANKLELIVNKINEIN